MVRRRTNGLCSGPDTEIMKRGKILPKKFQPKIFTKKYFLGLTDYEWEDVLCGTITVAQTCSIQYSDCADCRYQYSEKEIFIGMGFAPLKELTHLTKRKPKYLFYWKENFSYQNGLIFISWSFFILMFSIAKIKDNVQFSIFIKWHIILQMNYGSSCIQLLNSVYMTKNCQATVDWRGQFLTF